MLGGETYGVEAGGFRPSQHKVHALQRSAGSTLHEVIDDCGNDESVCGSIDVDSNLDVVGSHYRLRLWLLSIGKHLDERLITIGLFVEFLYPFWSGVGGRKSGGEDAARHRG